MASESVNDFDSWSEVYDLIYSTGGTKNDDDFYRQLLERTDSPAVEMACGNGRLYLDFLEEGFEVHGVDISEGMLESLRERAAERGLDPTVWQGNSRTVSLEREYGLVYYPFSALQHSQGIKHQRDNFHNCYSHLQEGGLFAFDLPLIDFERVCEYGKVSREQVSWNEATYLVESWSELTSKTNQEVNLTQRVIDVESDKIVFENTFELTLLPKEQVELLLIDAGFSDCDFYGDSKFEPLTDDHEQMSVVAEK